MNGFDIRCQPRKMVAVVIILPPLLHGIPVVRGSVKLEDSKAVYISKWEVILKV